MTYYAANSTFVSSMGKRKKYWIDACLRVVLIWCAIKNDNLISAQGKTITIAPRV